MLYLDTSLVVTALTNEQTTRDIQIWLDRQHSDQLAISNWTITEVSSALSMKVRTKEFTAAERDRAATKFDNLRSTNFKLLAVTPAHFWTAARFAARYELGLRASDALHLAIAAQYQATLFSLDRRLIKAGPSLGLLTKSPLT